jgi:hypothetical protein
MESTADRYRRLAAAFAGTVGGVPDDAWGNPTPCGDWTARDLVRHVVDSQDPVAAATEFDGFFGRTSFSGAVERFLCLDLVVHRWDLAHATGLDTAIPDTDVRFVSEGSAQFGDAMRGPGAFGEPVDPPEGADDQARMLAFLGRRA